MIHPTAIIDDTARIADDVEIGPYSIIGAQVEIAAGSWIGPHVVINGPTRIGKNNRIFQFASIGEEPQDLKFAGEPTRLEIGDNNTIRENVTISRGTVDGGNITRIGNDNLLMAYVHIAHDCQVGDHIIFANSASCAGHVEVGITRSSVVSPWCTSFPKSAPTALPAWVRLSTRMYHLMWWWPAVTARPVVSTRWA